MRTRRVLVAATVVALLLIGGCAGVVEADGAGRPPYPGTLTLPERGHAWPGPETFRIGNAIAPVGYWMTAWMLNDVLKMAGIEEEIGDTGRSTMWVPVVGGQWRANLRRWVPVDEHGWPLSMELANGRTADRYSTIVMGDEEVPPAFPAGRYRLLYEGEGRIVLDGAEVVSDAPGETIVEYDGHRLLVLSIESTNPDNHLRNIRLLRPDAVSDELFPRAYLDYLKPFSVIRPVHFFGEQLTYGPHAVWEERKPFDYSHWGGAFGAPFEVAIALANESASDLWINVPIAADDSYVRGLAELTLTGLDPARRIYLEYGNELWNFAWPYELGRQFVLELAERRWPGVLDEVRPWSGGDPVGMNEMIYSFQGIRTVEIRSIFHEVWGDESDRVTAVLAGQLGGSHPFWDPSRDLLGCTVAVGEEGVQPCGFQVDAFGVASYISDYPPEFAFDRSSPEAFIADAIDYVRGEGAYGPGAPEPGIRYQVRSDRRLAEEYGLPLVAYEGGQHFTGSRFTRDEVANHPQMRRLYDAMFDVWQEEGGGLFVHFAGIIPRGRNEPGMEPTYFQSENFGIKERQTQTRDEAPKWDEVLTTMEEIGQIE